MAINSKDITLLIISLIGASILSIFLQYKKFNLDNLQSSDWIIILVFVVGAIVWIIYSKINEVTGELDIQQKEQKRLNEKLKIHEQLINLKARVLALENKDDKKK